VRRLWLAADDSGRKAAPGEDRLADEDRLVGGTTVVITSVSKPKRMMSLY